MIRRAALGAWVVLHRVATLAIGTTLIVLLLLTGAAWRLARGPVDLAWLTHRLEAAVNPNGGPLRLSIGSTAVVWEGFRLGVDRPLDLRLTNVVLHTADGVRRVNIPRAEVSLSLLALLHGHVQPRALELDAPHLTLRRGEDGSLSIDLGDQSTPAPATSPITEPLPVLLALLARPAATDVNATRQWFSQLQRVRIRNAAVTVIDRRLGATWQAPEANVSLTRRPGGGIDGAIALSLALGDQQARLTATATVAPNAAETQVIARLTEVEPAALARATPALRLLAGIAAPVSANAYAVLGPTFDLRQARMSVTAGPGTVRIGAGDVPILGASLAVSATGDLFHLDDAQLRLLAHPGEAPTILTANGTVERQAGQVTADLSLGFDQVAFADLPTLWPAGVGGDARAWVLQNITGGIARNGHLAIGLAANADLSDLTLTRASGSLAGSDLTVWWLRPVPPIAGGQAVLRILDPDTLQIDVTAGRQLLKNGASLPLVGGSMQITGMMQHHQIGDIKVQVAGSLANTVALLREPRLQLLDRHPFPLNHPGGDVTATVTATVPLEQKVQMDDIAVQVDAHVTGAFLADFVAGRDLADGTLDLTANNDRLLVKGKARLADIPASLDAAMDFRAGPPTQVLQRVTVSGRADAKQLAAAGLDVMGLVTGPVDLAAVLTEQRNGAGSIGLTANLNAATMAVAALDWRKPPDAAAHAAATLHLMHDRLVRIDPIEVTGSGLRLRAIATCQNGHVVQVRLDQLSLGRTELAGTVSLPAAGSAMPTVVRVHGPVLDLSARLERPTVKTKRPSTPPPRKPPGPPWTLDASFDRVLMANGYLLAPFKLHAENDGSVFQRLSIEGDTRANGPFAVHITPEDGRRHLVLSAAKAGDLLRALDVTDSMQNGTLVVTGTYDDSTPAHALQATAELRDFRMLHDAVLGRLLQAMTLYGLVDALRGPGLSFSRLVAPFTLSDGVLRLADARAFSPSLGLTAKGEVDLDANTADLQGTIVPAYFFNSLLGGVPLVGRLFSPERGGGVFAATYGVRGDLDDPSVRVNPLTALTPGFLRGLFGIL